MGPQVIQKLPVRTIFQGVIGAQLSSPFFRLVGGLLGSRKGVRECCWDGPSLSGRGSVLVKGSRLYLLDGVC